MDRLDVQIKLVAECSQSLNSKFMEDFNQVAEEALRVQTQINHRIKDLHSGFFDQHSNLSSELRELNRIRTTLEDACVLMTKSLLGIEADSSTEKLEKEISNRVKELEEDRAKLNEMQKALELREECVRERLNHLEEMRRQQRKRLQGELDSSYLGLFRSLKRLRSEFEETYTCEEVATSLALDTEKKAAEKAHAACKKMFRSAENRVRRMEAVRRKRLAAFRSTLDELDQQLADTEDTPFEDGSGENSAANFV
ncbi:myosin heavy chain, fast skeletal muscle [Galendromus occidentalis]|uniref:Myosin heavy chain, fast skeletal muscle n=1 Tax=Galendromus occidentalis TaxID=34638 RepID=A0AAJ6QUE3_9ACAR|nr:myosin heavy chain, fast skeletal muscle [Galendromus occidentalis]